jgi:AcrR family transcriptional regulator
LTFYTGIVNIPDMGRRQTATRERILKAAFERFSHYGFRRTSMEDIAGQAGISRAALYLQFRNKEEIFRSLSQELHDEALARAAAALDTDQALEERLCAAVEAKSLRFLEIAHGSPHGSELMDESNRICGDLPAESQKRFQEIVTRVFRRADRTKEIDLARGGLTATDTADLFVSAVAGLKGPGVTVAVYRKRVAALVRLFLAGLGGSAAAVSRTRRLPLPRPR